MPAFDIDQMARDYVTGWCEEKATPDLVVNYQCSVINSPIITDCGHLNSIIAFQVMLYVKVKGSDEATTVFGHVPLAYIIDADVEPIEDMLASLWEQIEFITILGGADFDQEMDEVAVEVLEAMSEIEPQGDEAEECVEVDPDDDD